MPLLKEEYTKEEKHYNADTVVTLKASWSESGRLFIM